MVHIIFFSLDIFTTENAKYTERCNALFGIRLSLLITMISKNI